MTNNQMTKQEKLIPQLALLNILFFGKASSCDILHIYKRYLNL